MTFSIAELSDLALTGMVTYGPPVLFLVLLVTAAGLPLPSTLMVLAAGAFVRQGVLNVYYAFLMALVGAVLGDCISYGLGRFARGPIQRKFGNSPTWQKAEANIQRRGGIAVYLTRWLFTAMAIPTNLIAGSSGFKFAKFLVYDIAGELTWLFIFGSLGYAFGSQWEAVSQFITDFSGVLVGVIILATGIFLFFRQNKKKKKLVPVKA